jgi:predicted anti-sigma-YlaC factor YlaD
MLLDLLDRQLSFVRARTVLAHLDRCTICRQAIRQIARDRRQASSARRSHGAPACSRRLSVSETRRVA